MITLTRPSFYESYRYAEYTGLSTDNKSEIDAHNADQFYEIDTGKYYRYSEASGTWIEQPSGGSTSKTLPTISVETAGHFLSNNGTATHWQEIASSDFIIHLTENQDGTYAADKTYVEIKAAYDGKENVAVSINGARLPMMNAEIASDGNAGFTFGYTQVTTDGQLVHTRAVNYYHSDDADEWTDIDQVGEYVRVNDAVSIKKVELARNSALTVSAVDGTYLLSACDEIHRGLVCAFVCGNTTTISALTGTPGWEVTKGAVANSLYINNKSDTASIDVNIIKI